METHITHEEYTQILKSISLQNINKLNKYIDLRRGNLVRALVQEENTDQVKNIQGRIKELDQFGVFLNNAKGN